MSRRDGEEERLRALAEGAESAPIGTNASGTVEADRPGDESPGRFHKPRS
jgi:hypothetical protein